MMECYYSPSIKRKADSSKLKYIYINYAFVICAVMEFGLLCVPFPIKEWLIFLIKESSILAFQIDFSEDIKTYVEKYCVIRVHMTKHGIGD